jgi:hypothetical protein
MPYYGEEQATLGHRMVEQWVAIKRMKFEASVRLELARRQSNNCAMCDEPLVKPDGTWQHTEINHKRALALHGDNSPENLELLCLMCHNMVTESQVLHGVAPRLCSVLNPESAKIFRDAPKPRQISWGNGAVDEKVYCVDVARCRQNALTKRPFDLPVFRFHDVWEPCLDDSGVIDMTFDFYYVDAEIDWDREFCGCPDRKQCPYCHGSNIPASRRRAAPYDGAHVYPVDVVQYLLDQEVIQHRHVTWGKRASTRLQPEAPRRGQRPHRRGLRPVRRGQL